MYRILFFFCLISVCLFSCASRIPNKAAGDNLVIFPAPPDTTRIQYLTTISSSIDVTGQRSGFMEWLLGKEEGKSIIKPYGISIYKGKIYICDTMLGGLEIIDLDKKTFNYFEPLGRGQLKKPINCSVDFNGNLYVADAGRHEIVVFDSSLKYIDSFCDATTMKPTDVIVYDGSLWVCDIKSHKIHEYSLDGYNLIKSFPDAVPKTDEFLSSPTNISIKDDKIYISDFGAFKIKVYSTDGQYLKSIGSYGRALGQFVRPKGIAIDDQSLLYVVDAGFENVQIFNPDDKLLMYFGGNYEGPGHMWLPAKVILDKDNLDYFRKYVHPIFILKYLIFVTNQYGPDKINVYGYVEPKLK